MTKIEWVRNIDGTSGRTWNPVTGCSPVSEGCRNCYAERMARRLAGRYGYPKHPFHFDVTLHFEKLSMPLQRKKPTTYFVCSMSDLFHKDVPPWFICEVWQVMRKCPQHTFQILTKRPERMCEIITTYIASNALTSKPLPNVWLGVTIESPDYCYRAQYLRETPAAIQFISFEPLLAPFSDYPGVLDDMDWIIAGGETGPGARPMHPDWARSLRDQCQAADIPFFFKSHGAWAEFGSEIDAPVNTTNLQQHTFADGCWVVRVGKKAAGRVLDGQTWDEFPGRQT